MEQEESEICTNVQSVIKTLIIKLKEMVMNKPVRMLL